MFSLSKVPRVNFYSILGEPRKKKILIIIGYRTNWEDIGTIKKVYQVHGMIISYIEPLESPWQELSNETINSSSNPKCLVRSMGVLLAVATEGTYFICSSSIIQYHNISNKHHHISTTTAVQQGGEPTEISCRHARIIRKKVSNYYSINTAAIKLYGVYNSSIRHRNRPGALFETTPKKKLKEPKRFRRFVPNQFSVTQFRVYKKTSNFF